MIARLYLQACVMLVDPHLGQLSFSSTVLAPHYLNQLNSCFGSPGLAAFSSCCVS